MISDQYFAASRANGNSPFGTNTAGNTDDNEGIEGEAVAIVHGPNVRFLFRARQAPPCPR